MYKNLFCLGLIGASLSSGVSIAVELTDKSQQLMVQLQEQIVGTMLEVARLEQAEGKDTAKLTHAMVIPAKNYIQMGMLIDTSDFTKGFPLVSVTKNGAADKAGLQVGDVIKSINGIAVADLSSKQELFKKWFVPEDKILKLNANRSGEKLSFELSIPEVYLPEVKLTLGNGNLCGVLNVINTPPEDSNLFGLKFRKLEDKNIYSHLPALKLPVGKHKIAVEVGSAYSNNVWDGGYKTIEFDVKANTKYYLAAEVSAPELDTDKVKPIKVSRYELNEDSWQPVIWKTESIECELD